jgi:hypothetical protein
LRNGELTTGAGIIGKAPQITRFIEGGGDSQIGKLCEEIKAAFGQGRESFKAMLKSCGATVSGEAHEPPAEIYARWKMNSQCRIGR